MDAYLQLAETILRSSRRPLTAREILRRGYAEGIVPSRLHGKTQHKTLQARISEDILIRRTKSTFFRTKPGHFFLSEFLFDPEIPEQFRIPIVARRRRRELAYRDVLAFDVRTLTPLCRQPFIANEAITNLLKDQKFHYASNSTKRSVGEMIVWAFVLVLRGPLVLTYRRGKYREDRDSFLHKRSLGFFAPVVHDDLNLFDQSDHGIVDAGLRALSYDLGLPAEHELNQAAELDCFICADDESGQGSLLALVNFKCPNWFEPLTRRLAINDLAWHNLEAPVNHIDDFDPWSRLVLARAERNIQKAKLNNEVASWPIHR